MVSVGTGSGLGTVSSSTGIFRLTLASVESSYELLTPVERALFDRVSVFTAPFTLEAAERVCSGEGISADDVLDVLTALVDKSLVSRIDGADRVLEVAVTAPFVGRRPKKNSKADDHRPKARDPFVGFLGAGFL